MVVVVSLTRSCAEAGEATCATDDWGRWSVHLSAQLGPGDKRYFPKKNNLQSCTPRYSLVTLDSQSFTPPDRRSLSYPGLGGGPGGGLA